MPSWQVEPRRLAGGWLCFRQVSPDWPPLYHSAGETTPSQESGRWHRVTEGYAQYMSLSPMGAWAEWARYASIRSARMAREQQRNLWLVYVSETEIADLRSFDRYESCGLDPAIAVGPHGPSQLLADELRTARYRGLLSPSAALSGVMNLTVFGERFEKVLVADLEAWSNPDPDVWLPCSLVSEAGPMPVVLTAETVFLGAKHEAYRAWLRDHGRPLPRDPP